MGSKRVKLNEEEDRISDLSDHIIQHILSFLPSTKEAIQTGILSKRWQKQWTRVPILIFNSTSKNDENFSQFIDKTLTLYDCSKIKKLHMEYDYKSEKIDSLTSKIRFATRKNVEELILRLINPKDDEEWDLYPYVLPKFLYNNGSLVKLELFQCTFVTSSNWSINWSRLKKLKLECYSLALFDSMIKKVLSGCPVLESLELTRCISFDNIVIASKSLKKLIFVEPESNNESDQLEISCPNLEELSIVKPEESDIDWSDLPVPMIENVLSSSLLLHTLVVPDWCLDKVIIASKSLKKLVLGKIYQTSIFEISCPKLEELNLYRFVPMFRSFEDIDSQFRWEQCLTKKIFGQLQNVKLLEIGSWLIKNLSALEAEEDLSFPLLNCKCLTLDGTKFDEHLPGIIRAIRSSPVLEKLVIKLELNKPGYPSELNDCGKKKNYWNSSVRTVFNCSVSNLKTVKIVGFSDIDEKHKLVVNFVEFLLKNARMLEKIVVILADCGKGFLFEVSKKILSFQRCFPHTNIELL